MIVFYSGRNVYAGVFIKSLMFFLGENVERRSFDIDYKNQDLDLVIIDGKNIHHQRLKKTINCYERSKIILISDIEFMSIDVASIVSEITPVCDVATVCKAILQRGLFSKNMNFNIMEELLLKKLGQGASNKEMARDYNLELSMVKYHLRNLYKKMNVNNRTQAALKVRKTIL